MFPDYLSVSYDYDLTENGEVVKTELETAETLNIFFGNVTKSLMIPKYNMIRQQIGLKIAQLERL